MFFFTAASFLKSNLVLTAGHYQIEEIAFV